jgi:hypothetical protein
MTRFSLEAAFVARYPVCTVSASLHREPLVAAEALDRVIQATFNRLLSEEIGMESWNEDDVALVDRRFLWISGWLVEF